MRFKDLLRRCGSGLLALSVAAGLAMGPMGPLTAEAAGSELRIRLLDAETGDGTGQGLARLEAAQIMYRDVTQFYQKYRTERMEPIAATDSAVNEARGLGYDVYTKGNFPESPYTLWGGGAVQNADGSLTDAAKDKTFYREVIEYHPWRDDYAAGGGHSYEKCYLHVDTNGDGRPDEWRWSAECLKNHTPKEGAGGLYNMLHMSSKHGESGTDLVYSDGTGNLKPGHIYVLTQGDNAAYNAFCYEPNVYRNDGGFYSGFQWGRTGTVPPDAKSMAVAGDDPIATEADFAFGLKKPGDGAGTYFPSAMPEGQGLETALSMYPMRGGFSFSVRDVETKLGTLQAMEFPSGSIFAVFNVNSTASGPQAYKDLADIADKSERPGPASSITGDPAGSEYGQVRVRHTYRDKADNTLHTGLSGDYRAYTYQEVMSAYDQYLSDCADAAFQARGSNRDIDLMKYLSDSDKALHYNGLYEYKGTTLKGRGYDYTVLSGYEAVSDRHYDICAGLFSMNGVVPCAMLAADDNGNVSTKSGEALPPGNYLVLQVRSPSGYYIDENFRLGVSIGPWYYNYDPDISSSWDWGRMDCGYGNSMYAQFGYTLRDTSKMALGEGSYAHGRYGKARDTKGWPVAYVASDGFEHALDESACSNFFVQDNGQVSNQLDSGWNITYRKGSGDRPEGLKIGKDEYKIDKTVQSSLDDSQSAGTRRYPLAGYCRLTAWLAPVRAGVSFQLADADSLEAFTKANPGATSGYAAVPQGDADLAGADFRLYHSLQVGDGGLSAYIENSTESGGSIKEKKRTNYGFTTMFRTRDGLKGLVNDPNASWENGSGSYMGYTSIASPDRKGGYLVNIPPDSMVYGEYTLAQVSGGPGYGAGDGWIAAHKSEELTVTALRVVGEDTVYALYGGKNLAKNTPAENAKATIDRYTVGGVTYLPQTVYRGDAAVSVMLKGGDAQAIDVNVRVINISANPVLLPDGKGGMTRQVGTAKAQYQSGLEGRAGISVAELDRATAGGAWSDALVWEGTVKSGATQSDALKGLPYGTYLIAVVGAPGKYAPIGGAAQVLEIRPDQSAALTLVMADGARVPVIGTEMTDKATGGHDAWVSATGAFGDKVSLSNLQPGVDYMVYGMLADRSTGEKVPNTKIASAKSAAFQPQGGIQDFTSRLANLITAGDALTPAGGTAPAFDGSYSNFITAVQGLANDLPADASHKEDLAREAGQIVADRAVTAASHGLVMGWLRNLYNNMDTSGLTGKNELVLDYGLDTRALQGRSVVSYVFVCEAPEADPAVMTATSVNGMRSAMGLSLSAEHAQASNALQTVRVPSLDIQAHGPGSQKKTGPGSRITVTASYGNLEPGAQYRVTASIRDKDGKDVTGPDGAIQASQDFTPAGNGTVSLQMPALPSGSSLNGQRLTAYVTLYRLETANGAVAAMELASKGDAQSMGWTAGSAQPGRNQVDVSGATVKTTLTDSRGNKETDFRTSSLKLKDHVEYTDLVPGQAYTYKLSLYYPGGTPVADGKSGKAVEATGSFMPSSASYKLDIPVTLDGRSLTDSYLVAYHDLYVAGSTAAVASEHDPSNAAQTVTDSEPEGRYYFQTKAKDNASGTQYTSLGQAVPVTDSVQVRGLEPEQNYKLETEVADARTGSVIGSIPKKTATVKSGKNGTLTVDVGMTINTQPLAGRAIVFYETLYDEDGYEVIAEHRDYKDTDQTLYVPGISTFASATDGKSKTVWPEKKEHEETSVTTNPDGTLQTNKTSTWAWEAVVRDRIDYVNLVPGNPYTVETTVSAAGGGQVASLKTSFSPSGPSGSTEIDITIDAKDVMGKEVYVSQTVTDDLTKKMVLTHDGKDDADQTVKVGIPGEEGDPSGKPGEKPGETPGGGQQTGGQQTGGTTGGKNIQTGVDERYGLFFALAGLFGALGLAAAGYALYRRRR